MPLATVLYLLAVAGSIAVEMHLAHDLGGQAGLTIPLDADAARLELAALKLELAASHSRLEISRRTISEMQTLLLDLQSSHKEAVAGLSRCSVQLEAACAQIATLQHDGASLRGTTVATPNPPVQSAAFAVRVHRSTSLVAVRGAPEGAQSVRNGAARSLLQDGPSARFCSRDEAQTVMNAPDRVAAVMVLMATNAACGMCIIPCASAPSFDIVRCLFGCQHQDENGCSDEELPGLLPSIGRAKLDDRESVNLK
jgi:hypothetical protein